MAKIPITLKVSKKWLEDIQKFSDQLDISRTAAIIICSRLGMKVIENLGMTQDQFDRLLEKK